MIKGTTKLQVEAIEHGTVIDHIPVGQGIKILKHLRLLDSMVRVTVGFNLPSKAMRYKDIIKIESRLFTKNEADGLSIFAPNATINIIKNYNVEKKSEMSLPTFIKGLFSCPNSNCITHLEPVSSSFKVSANLDITWFKCTYCEITFTQDIMSEM